jgi:hypothetical protein
MIRQTLLDAPIISARSIAAAPTTALVVTM